MTLVSTLRPLAVLLISLLTFSCVDKIDLAQGEALISGIFADGRAIYGRGVVDIKISAGRLFQFTSNRADRFPSGQAALEFSDGRSYPLTYRFEDGTFDGSFKFPTSSRDTVRLRLRLDTGEGEILLSAWEDIPPAIVSPIIKTEPVTNEKGETERLIYSVTTATTDENGKGIPLLYRLKRAYLVTDFVTPFKGYCFITENITGRNLALVYPNDGLPGAERTIELADLKVDYRFAEGHYFYATQEALTPSTAEYFQKFLLIANQDASIFAPPPGQVPGNFRDINDPDNPRIFGNFYVTRPDTLINGTPPFSFPEVEPYCNYSGPPKTACGNCLLLPGASRLRPDYWQF